MTWWPISVRPTRQLSAASARGAAKNSTPGYVSWTEQGWTCRYCPPDGYDSVGHGYVPALRCAIDSFCTDRLLLGTDFPYEAGDVFVRAVDYITDPRITEHEASAILEGNAAALPGITTPANAARQPL